MIDRKEAIVIIVTIFLMTLLLSFTHRVLVVSSLLNSLIISTIVILISVFCKKIVAKKINTEITFRFWGWKQFWISRRAHFEKPIIMGLILPLLLGFLSRGSVKFLTFLEFTTKALPSKAVKKYGKYRFKDVNEWDDGLIIFYSMMGLLLVSIVTDFFSNTLLQGISNWALFYAAYSLIPLGSLDGMKLLFASKPLYIFSAIIIGLISLVVLF
jgi:hypothetical protein